MIGITMIMDTRADTVLQMCELLTISEIDKKTSRDEITRMAMQGQMGKRNAKIASHKLYSPLGISQRGAWTGLGMAELQLSFSRIRALAIRAI